MKLALPAIEASAADVLADVVESIAGDLGPAGRGGSRGADLEL